MDSQDSGTAVVDPVDVVESVVDVVVKTVDPDRVDDGIDVVDCTTKLKNWFSNLHSMKSNVNRKY